MGITVKKPFIFAVLAALSVSLAHPQTAAFMDALLDSPAVTFNQAAAFVLAAAGAAPDNVSPEEAFARVRPWLSRWAAADAPIAMGELSYLFMRAFNLRGGFMYMIFPGPRYAYRALAYYRLLPGSADPGRMVTGEELLYIGSRVLTHTGEEAALARDEARRVQEEAAASLKAGVGPSQGLSVGAEGTEHYEGEFEIE
jgi:hypothetical protein